LLRAQLTTAFFTAMHFRAGQPIVFSSDAIILAMLASLGMAGGLSGRLAGEIWGA
jgi:hypothetical protein